MREFETRRGDREVDRVFRCLELTTELRDGAVDRLRASCDSTLPSASANLLVAQSMAQRILEAKSARAAEIGQALEASRSAREREWVAFVTDAQDRCAKVDDAYSQKEAELCRQYEEMERKLSPN